MKDRIMDFFYDHEVLLFFAILLAALLAAGIMCGVCWLGFLPVAHAGCANTAEVMGVDYEWRVFGGCFLELDGVMLPEDRWYYLRLDHIPSGG